MCFQNVHKLHLFLPKYLSLKKKRFEAVVLLYYCYGAILLLCLLFFSSDIFRIAITTRGKYAAIHAQSIRPLVTLVDDINSEVRVNAIKVSC